MQKRNTPFKSPFQSNNTSKSVEGNTRTPQGGARAPVGGAKTPGGGPRTPVGGARTQGGGARTPVGVVRSGVGVAKRSVEDLQKELNQVNAEVGDLKAKGYQESELQTHIHKMHEYNELKDIGQMVLGQLATVRGLRTKDLYEEYGLELDD